MKRLWIGIALLLALLVLGVGTALVTDAVQQPVSRDLEQAAQAAQREDWQQARFLYCRAKDSWDRSWRLIAIVADHTPMEEIDGLFQELQVYEQNQETVHFAATCAQLSRQTRAVGEAHSINWWNLL